MTDESVDEQELDQVLTLANGYLSEAESVLWTAADEFDADDWTDDLESVTQAVWSVQHQLLDLQRDLNEQR